MSNYVPLTITLEENYDFKVIEEIKHYLNELKNKSKFGSDPLRLKIIHDYLGTLLKTIYLM